MLRTLALTVLAAAVAAPADLPGRPSFRRQVEAAQAPGAAERGTPQRGQVNPNAATLQEFVRRVDDYVALHRKHEATLPRLPDKTDPKRIDAHERALLTLMQAARAGAKPGDIFFPEMQRLVRELLRPVFQGRDAAQIKAEIVDSENSGAAKVVVNGRYPDEIPLSTVPPQVLAQLPKLPEDLQYRFIRTHMILFDPHAHMIVDFVERAFQ
jgi:hypothetical protein